MKLLVCAFDIYSRVGGIQRFNQRVLRSASELRGQAIESCTALALWDGPQDKASAPRNVEFVGCSYGKMRMLAWFAWLLLTRRPDVVVYGHILLAPLVAIGRFLRPRARHMVVVHGFEVWDKPNFAHRWLVRRLMNKVVSVSVFTAEKMAAAYGLTWNHFLILPNATDVEESCKAKTNGDLSQEFRLLTVARLTDQDGYKGHEKVIRAMPQVLKAFPHAHYYIVGDGPLKEPLRHISDELGVGSHVHLLGYVDDESLEKMYAKSHIFILPSKKEGFGIVFLEAWKHRLPVIAGNQDASPEVVQHNVTGLIVDPDSSDEIAQAVIALLADTRKRKQMGENGWSTLMNKYTHEKFRARLSQVLN